MNVPCKVLFAALTFFLPSLCAQDLTKVANVNIVNATTLPLKLDVTYTDTAGEGGGGEVTLKPGDDMGLFSVDSEQLSIGIESVDSSLAIDPLSGHVKLEGNTRSNCYVVAIEMVAKKVDGEEVEVPVFRLKKVKAATEEGGYSLTVVSACAEPRLLTFANKQVRLIPWEEQLLAGWKGQPVPIMFEGNIISRIQEHQEPMTVLTVVYEDEDKNLKFNTFLYALRD
ncbi:MAG: hypothetical protein ACQKBY_05790 [Verrucomicrobiales bacterium]